MTQPSVGFGSTDWQVRVPIQVIRRAGDVRESAVEAACNFIHETTDNLRIHSILRDEIATPSEN